MYFRAIDVTKASKMIFLVLNMKHPFKCGRAVVKVFVACNSLCIAIDIFLPIEIRNRFNDLWTYTSFHLHVGQRYNTFKLTLFIWSIICVEILKIQNNKTINMYVQANNYLFVDTKGLKTFLLVLFLSVDTLPFS